MVDPCAPPKPLPQQNPCECPRPPSQSRTQFSELLSWRLLKKNPSGGLVWGIFGAAFAMDCFFYGRFLWRKEYQVDHKKRMWNERIEMLKDPVKMKLYYPSSESLPKVNQPLLQVNEEMEMMGKIQDLLNLYKDKNITVDVPK